MVLFSKVEGEGPFRLSLVQKKKNIECLRKKSMKWKSSVEFVETSFFLLFFLKIVIFSHHLKVPRQSLFMHRHKSSFDGDF
jgi:hypothetical protein